MYICEFKCCKRWWFVSQVHTHNTCVQSFCIGSLFSALHPFQLFFGISLVGSFALAPLSLSLPPLLPLSFSLIHIDEIFSLFPVLPTHFSLSSIVSKSKTYRQPWRWPTFQNVDILAMLQCTSDAFTPAMHATCMLNDNVCACITVCTIDAIDEYAFQYVGYMHFSPWTDEKNKSMKCERNSSRPLLCLVATRSLTFIYFCPRVRIARYLWFLLLLFIVICIRVNRLDNNGLSALRNYSKSNPNAKSK